ncbi:substrate-binding periplasmic protein [Vibrio marisflavi]|uniref:Solute-binding protein family 3/N-terminal domain-containing protein n=1 Tax=Vibrio marisflavi CECT 7928 TaxID=634439 RepID=A0ABM9A581_9VIBR|nr:transporter substrate-binding domain-containing protein [Vibrio marisflavi]CAH0540283.1 hypothetical protein VMF7928_02728 [Vibrio marisflavi CECT 7928]
MCRLHRYLGKLYLVFLTLLVVTSSHIIYAETIRLANGEWPPFQSQHLKHSGFISHIISEAFAAEGIKVEFEYLPWKRGYRSARYGELDGTFVWGKTPERAELFYYSDVVINLTTSVMHQADKEIYWDNVEDLGKYRIGGVIGYDYELSQYETSGVIEIKRQTKLEGALKMLARDRFDIVFADIDVGLYTANQLGLKGKIVASDKKINANKPFYLLISKKTPNGIELIEAFNRGLNKINQSGLFEQFQEANRRGEYFLK